MHISLCNSHPLHSVTHTPFIMSSLSNTMNVPPQPAYLYYGSWTPEIDAVVVNTIIKLKRETRWMHHDFPTWFLMTAQQIVEEKSGIRFTEQELKQRLDFMKLRYQTFKAVQRYEGAYWDTEAKFVRAKDELWQRIMKEMPFAGAYYYQDEPQFSLIACLYGLDDVKKEGEVEVVVLSDRTEKISEEEPSCYEVDDCNAEVNSPAVFPPRTVRRKLFSDEGEPTDRESTTDIGIYFIDLTSDGLLRTRLEKGRALPKLAEGGPSTRSPNASSCASNSPLSKWAHRNN